MKQPLLGQVLECLLTTQKVNIVDKAEGVLSGSAAALFEVAGSSAMNKPVYRITVKEGELTIEVGVD